MTELPFQAEYAKFEKSTGWGAATCKGCKEKFDQGVLRIAVMMQSPFFYGKRANWLHEECFFKQARVQSVTDIGNFFKLKVPDKKRIKKRIESNNGITLPVEKGQGKTENENAAIKDFTVEYSKSSQATCRHCKIKICKGEVRICKIVFHVEMPKKFAGNPHWHHVKCFAAARAALGFLAGGEDLPGFNLLSNKDQKMVKSELPPQVGDEVPINQLKSEPEDEDDINKEKDLEEEIENHDKLFHKFKKALQGYSKSNFHEENTQQIPAGVDKCAVRLADCMAFGVLEPCPDYEGQLVLENINYNCTDVDGAADADTLSTIDLPAGAAVQGNINTEINFDQGLDISEDIQSRQEVEETSEEELKLTFEEEEGPWQNFTEEVDTLGTYRKFKKVWIYFNCPTV